MSRQIGLLFVAAVLASLSVAPAFADEASTPINVKVNMARILRISAPASTVIVGNPAVADVHHPGPADAGADRQELRPDQHIVLDSKGNPIADTLVEVVQSAGRHHNAAAHHDWRAPVLSPDGDGRRLSRLHPGTYPVDGAYSRAWRSSFAILLTIPGGPGNSADPINLVLGKTG